MKKKTLSCRLVVVGVAGDDVGERRVLDRGELRAVELVQVEEPIAVAESLELIGDDPGEGLAHAAAVDMLLGQAADPEIDLVDGAVNALQLRLHGGIAGDVGEGFRWRQAEATRVSL